MGKDISESTYLKWVGQGNQVKKYREIIKSINENLSFGVVRKGYIVHNRKDENNGCFNRYIIGTNAKKVFNEAIQLLNY